MDAYEYHLKVLKSSRLSVPKKEQADKMWNDLIPCPQKEEALLHRQWMGVVLPSSGASGLSGICGAIASMKSMGYIVEEAERLMEAGLEALEKKNWKRLRVITSEIHRCLYCAKEDSDHKYRKFQKIETWQVYNGGSVCKENQGGLVRTDHWRYGRVPVRRVSL